MNDIVISSVTIFIICLTVYLFFQKAEKRKWFYGLKAGDKVFTTIYSENCQCEIKSVVKDSAKSDMIEVEVSDDVLEKCRDCAEKKGYNDKGEMTCWYKVKFFKSYNVRKDEDSVS